MSTSIEHQMTELYCFVGEFLKQHPALAHWRHSPHAQPHFTDAEVLTIALLQGGFEVAIFKQTYWLVAQDWRLVRPERALFLQEKNLFSRELAMSAGAHTPEDENREIASTTTTLTTRRADGAYKEVSYEYRSE